MRIAVIGTGAIGASWSALFLAHGHRVVAGDPAPGAEDALRAALRAHGADDAALEFAAGPAEAADGADFVQENGPERLAVKDAILAALDEAAPPATVIASSSSGLKPSDLQRACARHPERVLVGHPFNPPHLVPLVEVVPGARTAEAAVEAALAFYRGLGKRPVRVRRELPGHLANRLQAALWREAYALVEQGAASVADIDAAIANGPGLRWALLGPFLTQHLSGGPGGIAHVLEHLGPPMEDWWDDLGDPRLSPALTARIVAGVEEELAGADPAALAAERDALLTGLLAAKSRTDHL
ncbi:3-hydroxyacyl-CoA dehydrogenase NAD-binding domain-containing protein [Actinomadura parmotrematis]|uniref:3-hydroxyacyl-CoA dehydrogenase n=1 Tax=Actinomadura parmotrematis TaxID=2864039 RepID=A0ABS7G493_9ACTN|nr:3-hydroxyacyl-CoA dehydrogenase NAD-binding domain-containing protein [Actinomadura parmotrematis]MBW8487513.1 3-hydroxyacyl-CoA dehydrogenase [Actinomadura parmotrematis]